MGKFNHYAHIRLAYIYLSQHSAKKAYLLMKDLLLSLLKKNGINPSSKYSETITVFWMITVYYFMKKTKACNSAESFINRNPQLLDEKRVFTHYSSEILLSEKARKVFVPPDIQEIPGNEYIL